MAAVLCPHGVAADALLDRVARVLRSEGYRIAGLVQRSVASDGGARALLHVADLSSGALLRITQDLGEGARGCRLDPGALAAAAGALMARLDVAADTVPDALILNRFGKAEAEGKGLRGVAEQACLRGIPVLAALRPGHRADWEEFSGGAAVILPPDEARVLTWLRVAIGSDGGAQQRPSRPAGMTEGGAR
ncbi:hypothetical protein U879_20675 [Defluviimonas sp. 20V17]|nr:hypothetical protein U879_20675 [Defluviimonas sp. 20V17]